VVSVLAEALPSLYPNATVDRSSGLAAEEVLESLVRPNVLGFFFVGQGDAKGAFITGPELEKVYPDFSACVSKYDLFGGFTSHSKYSPSAPAPKALRGLVLSRTEVLYEAAGAAPDSWPKFCRPRLSLVYPTRTFSGRMKNDALKFAALLREKKRSHMMKTLSAICGNCAGHVAAGNEVAKLCPPNSDVCRQRTLTRAAEQFALENYCLALAPAPSR
jgi:hypothetical protein